MSGISVNNCSTFIQIWVDTNELQNGSPNGVYLVDNMLNNGSSKEGTPSLNTNVPSGTDICWQILNIDPNSPTILKIESIGNASVWGASGQPEAVPGGGAFTGQAQSAGSAPYTLNFSAKIPGGSGITTSVTPSMSVH
jgi:hypothetical protein